jgi:hypothetical protein
VRLGWGGHTVRRRVGSQCNYAYLVGMDRARSAALPQLPSPTSARYYCVTACNSRDPRAFSVSYGGLLLTAYRYILASLYIRARKPAWYSSLTGMWWWLSLLCDYVCNAFESASWVIRLGALYRLVPVCRLLGVESFVAASAGALGWGYSDITADESFDARWL